MISAPAAARGLARQAVGLPPRRRAARGERLLFLDADTWLAPDAIGRSWWPTPTGRPTGSSRCSRSTRCAAPTSSCRRCATPSPCWPRAWPPSAPREHAAVAFGPCLLTRADALAAAGGFEAVADEVVEDMALAARLPAARAPGGVPRREATRCASACTPTARARWSRAGRRTSPAGPAGRAWCARLRRRGCGWRRAGDRGRRGHGSLGRDRRRLGALRAQLWWMLRRLGSFHPLDRAAVPRPAPRVRGPVRLVAARPPPGPAGPLAGPADRSPAGPFT